MVGHVIADFCARWLVANGPQGAVGSVDAFGRAEDVDIGLPSHSWISRIIGRLRKALDNYVLHTGLVERSGGFKIGCLYAVEAESVIGEIGSEPLDDPTRKCLHAQLRKRQCEMSDVAKVEQAGPLFFG